MSDKTDDDGESPPTRVGDWLVTADGLESRVTAGPDNIAVDYFVDRERLLKGHYRDPRVSDWAMQLAGKSWITSLAANAAMIEAVTTAIERHHPGQHVIDAAATREAAEREWERTHRRPPGGTYEYDFATGTLVPIDLGAAVTAEAQPDATDGAELPEDEGDPTAQPSPDAAHEGGAIGTAVAIGQLLGHVEAGTVDKIVWVAEGPRGASCGRAGTFDPAHAARALNAAAAALEEGRALGDLERDPAPRADEVGRAETLEAARRLMRDAIDTAPTGLVTVAFGPTFERFLSLGQMPNGASDRLRAIARFFDRARRQGMN